MDEGSLSLVIILSLIAVCTAMFFIFYFTIKLVSESKILRIDIAGIVIMMIWNFIICGYSYGYIFDFFNQNNWVESTAMISAKKVDLSYDSKGGKHYRTNYTYNYKYEGKEYKNSLSVSGSWEKSDYEYEREPYHLGENITIWFNKKDPYDSTEEKKNIFVSITFTLSFIFINTVFFGIKALLEARKQPEFSIHF